MSRTVVKTNNTVSMETALIHPGEHPPGYARGRAARRPVSPAPATAARGPGGDTRAFASPPGVYINRAVRNRKEDVMERSSSSEAPAWQAPTPGQRSMSGTSRFGALVAGIAFALTLGACGGGSSSGGAGGSESFAGTYNGIATATLSAPGLPPDTFSGSIQVVIDAQGNVTSDPDTFAPGTGKLDGNMFTVTVPGSSFNRDGVSCTGAILIDGTISGDTINGTLKGSGFACNGIPISMTGTYSAARAAPGVQERTSSGPSVMGLLRKAVR